MCSLGYVPYKSFIMMLLKVVCCVRLHVVQLYIQIVIFFLAALAAKNVY